MVQYIQTDYAINVVVIIIIIFSTCLLACLHGHLLSQLQNIEVAGLTTLHRTHEISAQFIDNVIYVTIQVMW